MAKESRARASNSLHARLKVTLKTVFEKLDIEWNPPPIPTKTYLKLALFSYIAFLPIFVISFITYHSSCDYFLEPPQDDFIRIASILSLITGVIFFVFFRILKSFLKEKKRFKDYRS